MPQSCFFMVEGATNILENNYGRGTSWNVLSTIGTQTMHVENVI